MRPSRVRQVPEPLSAEQQDLIDTAIDRATENAGRLMGLGVAVRRARLAARNENERTKR